MDKHQNLEVGRYQASVTSDEDYIYVVRIDTRTGEVKQERSLKSQFSSYQFDPLP